MNLIRNSAKVTGATLVALALTMPAAHAAVTFDATTGTGFVGKGNVQTAFGWNNKQLQTNASTVTFSFSQDASQAVSQEVSQTASQTTTTPFTFYVSCNTTNGRRTFYREGNRSGVTEATREGTREGSRAGTLSGAISSALDGDPRQTKGQNQFTGFILKGFIATPVFTPGSDPVVYGDPTFGDWSWSPEAVETDEWTSGWQTTGEGTGSPADCVDGSDDDSNIVEDTVYGDPVEGDPVEGDVSYGAVTGSGVARVFATHAGITHQL